MKTSGVNPRNHSY